jgi:hypothetical protein
MDQEQYEKLMNRRRSKIAEAIEKRKRKMEEKRTSTIHYAIQAVHDRARRDCWCTDHADCFRATFGKGESKAHRDKKYQLWCEYREMGYVVFVECRLEDGSRPDLIVCGNNGEILIIEVAKSEKEESLLLKEQKYPFAIKIVRCF